MRAALQGGALLLIGAAVWKYLIERRVYDSSPREGTVGSWAAVRGALNRRVARVAAFAALLLIPVWLFRFHIQLRDFRDPFVPWSEDVNFLLRETVFGPVWFAQGAAILVLAAVLVRLGWKPITSEWPPDSLSASDATTPEAPESPEPPPAPAHHPTPLTAMTTGAPDAPSARVVSPSDSAAADVFRVPPGEGNDPLWWVVAVGAFGLALTLCLSSHALSVEENRAIAISADLLHTLAAGSWIGSLVLILATARIPVIEERGLFGAQLQFFSPLAVAAVTTLVAMGSWLAFEYLDSPSDLWLTPYGRVLTAKLTVAGVVLLIGFINWRRGMPSIESPDARAVIARRAAWEVGVAAIVLLLTGVLTGTPR